MKAGPEFLPQITNLEAEKDGCSQNNGVKMMALNRMQGGKAAIEILVVSKPTQTNAGFSFSRTDPETIVRASLDAET